MNKINHIITLIPPPFKFFAQTFSLFLLLFQHLQLNVKGSWEISDFPTACLNI